MSGKTTESTERAFRLGYQHLNLFGFEPEYPESLEFEERIPKGSGASFSIGRDPLTVFINDPSGLEPISEINGDDWRRLKYESVDTIMRIERINRTSPSTDMISGSMAEAYFEDFGISYDDGDVYDDIARKIERNLPIEFSGHLDEYYTNQARNTDNSLVQRNIPDKLMEEHDYTDERFMAWMSFGHVNRSYSNFPGDEELY